MAAPAEPGQAVRLVRIVALTAGLALAGPVAANVPPPPPDPDQAEINMLATALAQQVDTGSLFLGYHDEQEAVRPVMVLIAATDRAFPVVGHHRSDRMRALLATYLVEHRAELDGSARSCFAMLISGNSVEGLRHMRAAMMTPGGRGSFQFAMQNHRALRECYADPLRQAIWPQLDAMKAEARQIAG